MAALMDMVRWINTYRTQSTLFGDRLENYSLVSAMKTTNLSL